MRKTNEPPCKATVVGGLQMQHPMMRPQQMVRLLEKRFGIFNMLSDIPQGNHVERTRAVLLDLEARNGPLFLGNSGT